jgi:hypothetical protein
VDFDGNPVAGTSVLSSTQIQLTLPASDLTSAGTHTLTVINPMPGGGTSAGATLTVVNARPAATAPPGGGGGGRIDLLLLIVLLTIAAARVTAVLPERIAGE